MKALLAAAMVLAGGISLPAVRPVEAPKPTAPAFDYRNARTRKQRRNDALGIPKNLSSLPKSKQKKYQRRKKG